MRFVVGLTGGIGSGKSAVAERFAALGVPIVDTDAIAHELTGVGGRAIEPLQAEFGAAVITPEGALDRAAMRRLVFADPQLRVRLEGILHPLIRQESDARIQAATGADYALLVVPLLIESGQYRQRVDRVAVVDCPETTQLARVMARSGLSADEVRAIMAAQADRQTRLAAADDVIRNDAGLDALTARVNELHARYQSLAQT
jgi:dephospho-CoA kinase